MGVGQKQFFTKRMVDDHIHDACFGMYVCTYVMHVVSRINYGKSQATDNALGSCCASLSPSEEAESHTEFTERASSS